MPSIWDRSQAKKFLDVNVVTDSTKACRRNLCYGEPTEARLAAQADSLINIAKSCTKEEKSFIHLQLFWHLRYRSEIEPVLENPGNFAWIAPTYVTEAFVPTETYCTVVINGELMNHFLQMVLHMFDKKFVQELTGMVLEKFMSTEEQHAMYPFVLFFLGKISRRELDGEVEGNDFYLKQFITVLDGFVGHDLMPKYEKLCYLFRVAGVVVMKKEDYLANGSDFLELLEEWNFDLSNRIGQETRVYLTEFFEDKPTSEEIRLDILTEIEKAITKLDVSESDITEWATTPKTHRITWAEFIGVHAFLAKSVFEKYSSIFDTTQIENLLNLVSMWSLKRPKLTRDDFLGEIGNFDQFYKVLKRFGEKDRDRKNLLAKFTGFSYQDVYCCQTGLRIAEKYLVPGGDFETVSTYILNALNKEKMPESCRGFVPSVVKLLIQKLLCVNGPTKARKDELVPELFKEGAHSALILSDYTYHVNDLCAKLGSIEREVKDAAQIAHNRDLVFSTCLEDPINTVISVMEHSFVSHHFKVLIFAKPFLLLPSSHPSNNPPSVRNFCFQKIVVNAGGHDPILVSLAECVSKLISLDILDANDIYEILKQEIRTMLMSMMNLSKIEKLYQIINSIAVALIELNSKENQYIPNLKEIFRLVMNTKMLSYKIMPPRAVKEMLQIRTICATTSETIISSKLVGPDPFDKLCQDATMDPNFLLSRSLLRIGCLYVRTAQLQDYITTALLGENPAIDLAKLKSEFTFANVQNSLYTWVTDSAVEEWPTLLQFLTQVLPKSPIFEHDIVHVFNRWIPFVWRNCTEVKNQHMFRQLLKFYGKAVQHLLLQKGDLFPNREKQLDIVSAFVMLLDEIFQNYRKRKPQEKLVIYASIQQVMLVTLEVLNVMMEVNPTFEKDLKSNVLDRLSLLPFVKGGCEPIRKCIMERVSNYRDAKPVAKKNGGAGDQ